MPLVLDVKIPREEEFEGVDAQNGHKSLSLFFFFQPSVLVLLPLARGIGISLFRETRQTIVESAACRRLTTAQAIVLPLLTATQAYTPYT